MLLRSTKKDIKDVDYIEPPEEEKEALFYSSHFFFIDCSLIRYLIA